MSWWINLADLDEDQKDVISMPADGNYLVLGPPGSGKTNLLLIRAEYLVRSGRPSTLMLMFNEPLHNFVSIGAAIYGVPPEKVQKLMSWEMRLLAEHGRHFQSSSSDAFPVQRQKLATAVLDLLQDKPALEDHIQCLLVDEAQDLIEEEVRVVRFCAENVIFAGDSRQQIYDPTNVLSDLEGDLTVVRLQTHYRVGHAICQAADVVARAAGMDPIEPDCNYNGPISAVDFVQCPDEDEQFAKIITALDVQIKAFPGELLCVAVPRKGDVGQAMDAISKSHLADRLLPHRVAGTADPKQVIYVAHLREIKGLEFRAIHIAMADYISRLGPSQKRIAYTGITRAKSSVGVYFSRKIPAYLEQVRAALAPPAAAPDLAALFPGSKSRPRVGES